MKHKKGFTLIELLVVVSIIGVLIALVAPSLLSGRKTALVMKCMTQQKQMVIAWKSYATENTLWLVTPQTEEKTDWIHAGLRNKLNEIPKGRNWREEAISQGALGPFVNSVNLYRCPSDPRKESHRWSYSMNNFLGPHRGYSFKKPVRRMGELQFASQTMVFIDVNDKRHFNMTPFRISSLKFKDSANYWLEPPASWHQNGTIVSYADSHTKHVQWKSKDTSKINSFFEGGKEGKYNPVSQPGNPDLLAIQEMYDPGRWDDQDEDN